MCGPVLSAIRWLNFPSHVLGDPLHAVTDPENRYAYTQHSRIAFRRVLVVDRTRASRQDQSCRLEFLDIFNRSRTRQNGAEYLLLSDSPRNQLRVLSAKVQDHYPAVLGLKRPGIAHIFHFCNRFRHRPSISLPEPFGFTLPTISSLPASGYPVHQSSTAEPFQV